MKKFTKELKEINQFLESAKEILENHTHNDRYDKYIAVNVKRYNDYINIDDIIDNMKISEVKKEFLKNEFTDNYINDIYYNWIDDMRRYFCNDIIGGCRNSSGEYWDKEIRSIQEGQKNCYPYIEKLKTKEAKIKELEKWKARDQKELKYLSILDNKLCGFFGRSGGWLGIKEASILQNKIEEIENNLDCFENSDNKEDRQGYIEDALYYTNIDLINALNWIIEEIKSFNKGIDFKNEIEYRIENLLEENPFIEDVEAVNYAIN